MTNADLTDHAEAWQHAATTLSRLADETANPAAGAAKRAQALLCQAVADGYYARIQAKINRP